MTLVESKLVELGVVGPTGAQHAEFQGEGVLSVSGHYDLGEFKPLSLQNLYFTDHRRSEEISKISDFHHV